MSQAIKTCRVCGVTGDAALLFYKSSGLMCKECTKVRQREIKAEQVRTGKYQAWLDRSREARKKKKERIRRANGARLRSEIKVAAEEKRRIEEQRKRERMEARSNIKRLSPADEWRQKYWSDPVFHEKEKARVSARKKAVPMWYANQLLGGTANHKYPKELLLAKQAQLRIKHFLKEVK